MTYPNRCVLKTYINDRLGCYYSLKTFIDVLMQISDYFINNYKKATFSKHDAFMLPHSAPTKLDGAPLTDRDQPVVLFRKEPYPSLPPLNTDV